MVRTRDRRPGAQFEESINASGWENIASSVTTLATALPIIMGSIWSGILPPSPDNTDKMATAVAALGVVLLSFSMKGRASGDRKKLGLRFIVVFVCSMSVYVIAHSRLVAKVDEYSIVTGFGVSDRVSKDLERGLVSDRLPKTLLAYYGYEHGAEIWKGHALAENTLVGLLILWTCGLACGISCFVPVVQARHKSDP